MQALARRLGEDLEAGFKRIVAVDKREMRLAAPKQAREEAAEVGVDGFEGSAQALAALAVERADRAAQAIDRLGQFGLLGDHREVLRFGFGQFGRGDEVDRPEPLAVREQAIMGSRFLGSRRDVAAGKPDAFGQ